MIKSTKLVASMLLAAGCMFISCKNMNDPIVPSQERGVTKFTWAEIEDNRLEYSRLLAKALQNREVRDFIKREALDEFDLDTEILYEMVKNKKINSQYSFEQYLKLQANSEEEFNRIISSLPLLTIGVPHLPVFEASKWDIDKQVPIVAAIPTPEKRGDKIIDFTAFDGLENKIGLKKNIFPTVPTIIVKDSERIQVMPISQARLATNENIAHVDGDRAFVFASDGYNGKLQKARMAAMRMDFWYDFDSKVHFAYDNNLQYHRDYVYYGIAPELGVTTGTYNYNYGEYLTEFGFESPANAGHVMDDVATDWSDMNLEFQIRVSMIENKTTPRSFDRGFSVPLYELFNYTTTSTGITVQSKKPYKLPGKGIWIDTFEMDKFGDRWKFTIFESDQQTSQVFSQNIQITSSYGTNFNNGVKDGANFGTNSSNGTTYTQAYQLTIQGGPDLLYDTDLIWKDKVLTNEVMVHDGVNLWHLGYSNEVSTGTVRLSFEPRYRY